MSIMSMRSHDREFCWGQTLFNTGKQGGDGDFAQLMKK